MHVSLETDEFYQAYLFIIKSLLLLVDEPQSTDDFPMWAIIIVAVVCLLVLICIIVAAALIVGLVCSCSRTRKRKFEPTDIHRSVSTVNFNNN